jgi:hypothetical protein
MQLKNILKEKRRGKVTKGVLFLHDNALAHRALFPGLIKQLKFSHFSFDVEVIPAVETWLDGQLSEFFLSGLQKLEQRAKKCIELRGEYVE